MQARLHRKQPTFFLVRTKNTVCARLSCVKFCAVRMRNAILRNHLKANEYFFGMICLYSTQWYTSTVPHIQPELTDSNILVRKINCWLLGSWCAWSSSSRQAGNISTEGWLWCHTCNGRNAWCTLNIAILIAKKKKMFSTPYKFHSLAGFLLVKHRRWNFLICRHYISLTSVDVLASVDGPK